MHAKASAVAHLENDEVRAFVASMPTRYAELFDDEAVRAHAAIVERRGAAATRVEQWRTLPNGGSAICVVADDGPGLLSRISAALIVHGMDVVCAQAYCRMRTDSCLEAVDLFWVRPLPEHPRPSVGALDVVRMGEVLEALVKAENDLTPGLRFATTFRERRTGSPTRVRFERDAAGTPTILAIETDNRPGLLLAICTALLQLRIQITASDVRTEDGRACDEFRLAELDGRPLLASRKLEVQTQVLSAIESLWNDSAL